MIVSILVAVSQNGVIGHDGGMPWHLSSDLRRFKALTLGKPVIMGRKTYQSIGRPLPGRANIVVSRDDTFRPEGVFVLSSLGAAIAFATQKAQEKDGGEICIIGGGDIYRQAIGLADVLHVTHVEAVADGDTRFPEIDPLVWDETAGERIPAGERDSFPVRFVTYRRREELPHTL